MPSWVAIACLTWATSSTSSARVCTRTLPSPMVVTVSSSLSGSPSCSTAARTSSTVVAVTAVGAWKSAPPRNSMPRFSPRIAMARTQTNSSTAVKVYQVRRLPTISKERSPV